MIKVLGENYYIDLDEIEKYIDIVDVSSSTDGPQTEVKVNLIKFEMVKMLLDTVLTEGEEIDDKLGLKSSASATIPFKLAFNTLLNKKFINRY
jgi:predicted CoA-binding protein